MAGTGRVGICMKVIVAFSGGKDSTACLLWAVNEGGFKPQSVTAVFCDTGWEHPDTYAYITNTCAAIGVNLVVLKSKKFDGFIDLAMKKKRFPSAKARFCTEKLKSEPMIDYLLDEVRDHCLIIQGIRNQESAARSKMTEHCTFFRYYLEPYSVKDGKEFRHTYRKQDVLEFRKHFADDILRPIISWSANQVVKYILSHGLRLNPLYYRGAGRVGCYPCIMANHAEVKAMLSNDTRYAARLIDAEEKVGRTFFAPNYIPQKYHTGRDTVSGKTICTASDVIRYLSEQKETLFQDESETASCMSFYSICE